MQYRISKFPKLHVKSQIIHWPATPHTFFQFQILYKWDFSYHVWLDLNYSLTVLNLSIFKLPHFEVPDRISIFVRFRTLENLCAFFVRSKTLCPDFCAFKITYDQIFERSKPKFVHSNFDNLCVHVQTIVRSKTHVSRFLSGQKLLCVLHAFKSAYAQIMRLCPLRLFASFIHISCTQRFHNVFISSKDILVCWLWWSVLAVDTF